MLNSVCDVQPGERHGAWSHCSSSQRAYTYERASCSCIPACGCTACVGHCTTPDWQCRYES